MDLQLHEKRALVTGSSAGIGEAMVRRLAEEGASVIVHGRNRARVETIVAEIRGNGGRAEPVLGDLSKEQEAASVFDNARSALGGIDILVNNAGGYASRAWLDTTPETWREFYEDDVLPAVRLTLAAVPDMRDAGWGRIINIATGFAATPMPVMADYAAAKAALVNSTVSLAKELAGTGITVNTISPGLIATLGVEHVLRETATAQSWGEDWEVIQQRWMKDILRNDFVTRLGTVEEVADLTAFVASPRAQYIHGANLRIDGGLSPAVN